MAGVYCAPQIRTSQIHTPAPQKELAPPIRSETQLPRIIRSLKRELEQWYQRGPLKAVEKIALRTDKRRFIHRLHLKARGRAAVPITLSESDFPLLDGVLRQIAPLRPQTVHAFVRILEAGKIAIRAGILSVKARAMTGTLLVLEKEGQREGVSVGAVPGLAIALIADAPILIESKD